MDNRFFPLPFQFDLEKLVADLAACEAHQWALHYNKNDYAGDWTGIALRSASGDSSDINAAPVRDFQDTPLLALCPYFREILDRMPFEKETVRLLALAPGSAIKEHRDPGLAYEHGCFRLHIPILTDDLVSFTVDKTRLLMGVGQCWYANFDLPHSVLHKGKTRRVHLVVDGIRNAWTDRLFGEAGYDFDLEKQQKEYDDATKARMIEQLRRMDTPVAWEIIAKLETRAAPSGQAAAQGSLDTEGTLEEGWVPTAVKSVDNALVFKWLYVGEKPFSEPFFQETLQSAKRFEPNKTHPNQSSTLEHLIELAQRAESVAPTAFIFHVSRCGSTLLTQLLDTEARNKVLSEVPLLDDLLRLPFRYPLVSQAAIDQAFLAAIRLLGRKRGRGEQHLFVKTDCWHVFFYETYRRLFPNTPFLLLYRRPDEVLASQQRQRGLQSIPSSLEPALTGIPDDPSGRYDLDGYFSMLLGRIFAAFVRIRSQDANSFLVNYSTGQAGMLRAIEQATGLRFSQAALEKMERRGLFHAKKPYESFVAEPTGTSDANTLRAAMALYEQLEQRP